MSSILFVIFYIFSLLQRAREAVLPWTRSVLVVMQNWRHNKHLFFCRK